MIRVLIFGKTGQLASCLAEHIPSNVSATFLGRETADFALSPNFKELIHQNTPEIVINSVAYTAVDKAEDDEKLATTVNIDAVAALARAADNAGIPLIHISTDYVFSGDLGDGAYLEDDPTGPTGVYGATKLAGEQAVLRACKRAFVFRTAWVFSAYGTNFVKTMLALGESRDEIGVVSDQFGAPTSAHDLAAALWLVADRLISEPEKAGEPGVYHLVSHGKASWYEFAVAVFERAEKLGWRTPAVVKRLTTEEFPTRARRPRNSQLSTRKISEKFGIELMDWQDQIVPVLEKLAKSRKLPREEEMGKGYQ